MFLRFSPSEKGVFISKIALHWLYVIKQIDFEKYKYKYQNDF